MLYGLANSPSVFQGFMNEVFREYIDILIYSQNLAKHCHHVTQVLQQLRKHHLYLNLEKCEFYHPTVQFLDYIISADGIQMDRGRFKPSVTGPNRSRSRNSKDSSDSSISTEGSS